MAEFEQTAESALLDSGILEPLRSSEWMALLVRSALAVVQIPRLGSVIVVPFRLTRPNKHKYTSAVNFYLTRSASSSVEQLPLDRTLGSRFGRAAFASWPPESIESVSCVNGSLSITFKDPWFPYERPILPFGLDAESEWEAIFDPWSFKWSLHKIRILGAADNWKSGLPKITDSDVEAIEVGLREERLLC